jgi:hypothetical protein
MKKKKKSLAGPGDSYAKEVGLAVAPKLAIALVALVGGVLLLKPVFEKTGLIDSKEEQERKKAEAELANGTTSPFNPNFYKGKVGASLVTRATAENLAKQLYDAIGLWITGGDNENTVYGVLRQLKAKTQLSFVSDVFTQKYSADLYQYLRRNLNDSEMAVVNNIANNLAGLNGLNGFGNFNGLALR